MHKKKSACGVVWCDVVWCGVLLTLHETKDSQLSPLRLGERAADFRSPSITSMEKGRLATWRAALMLTLSFTGTGGCYLICVDAAVAAGIIKPI